MDTTFWGPSGWKLLHSITNNYPTKPNKTQKDTYNLFFNSIKYILPCIYCRRSYTQYLNELPIESYLSSKIKLSEWLYKLHNLVNDKLRKQGLNNNPDPTFDEIHHRYTNYVNEINNSNCINMPGWDFLYCILFNYPIDKNDIEIERQINYIVFFNYLPKVIPFKKAALFIEEYLKENPIKKHINSRDTITKWGYNMEKYVSKNINSKCISFEERCDYIEQYRAGCGGKKDKKPTCRIGNSPTDSTKK